MTVPPWLKKAAPDPEVISRMEGLLQGLRVSTVCREARCPNQGECFARGEATFLLLGERCTRSCGFCAISPGHPLSPDPIEPRRVARAVRALGLGYAVLTSVARDDLPDGGAAHFAATVEAIREEAPGTGVEALIPDYLGEALERVLVSRPHVLAHNLETVPRLHPTLRPQAGYRRSLQVLEQAKALAPSIPVKSGLMLGLGEGPEEVREAMADLRRAGCELITLGQYLPPSPHHYPLGRYVPPEEFQEYGRWGMELGFTAVAASPWVRSSFGAGAMFRQAKGGPPATGGRPSLCLI